MSVFEEADWRLRSAPNEDIIRTTNGNAMSTRIQEWLATPEGSMANHPSWGHNLHRFKHDPLSKSSALAVQIEMAVCRKLPMDIEDLNIIAIQVEVKDIDLCIVTIVHQYGHDSLQVRL